jgi:hypothetical protein
MTHTHQTVRRNINIVIQAMRSLKNENSEGSHARGQSDEISENRFGF